MRIAFMGTPRFAADILESIADRFDVACVFTRPDSVRSRGRKLEFSDVKQVAVQKGIEVLTPATLKDPCIVSKLEALDLDAIVVAAYGMILPKAVLDIPRYGCLNVHASLLPRWRGAAPIERAILAGDEYVGVCIMRMEEGLDTGDYCIYRSIPARDMNEREIADELSSLGSVALISALEQLRSGNVKWTAQDPDGITYAEKIKKGELDVSPHLSAEDIVRRVRASSEAHPSRCTIASRDVALLEVSSVSADETLKALFDAAKTHSGNNSVVYLGKKLYLESADGFVEVLSLKPSGKKAMDAKAFAAGMGDVRQNKASWGAIDA